MEPMEQMVQQLEQQSQQLDQQSQQLVDLHQRLQLETQTRQQSEQQLRQAQALATVRIPKPPETDGKKPTPEHFALLRRVTLLVTVRCLALCMRYSSGVAIWKVLSSR